MLQSFRQILRIFSPKDRLYFGIVFCAMLAMGVLQMAGVGVILPFVALLSNPDAIHDHAALQWLYTTLGFASTQSFLLFMGVMFLVILLASNAVTAVTLWLNARFSWGVQRRLSERLLDGYLHQPYATFLNRNSADIGKNVLIESQQFANGLLLNVLRSMAFAITALMILGFLLWLRPLIALAVFAIFGGAYCGIYLAIRRLLLRIGQQRMTANTERFRAVNEAFGSLKEVKVMGREVQFLKRYRPAASVFSHVQATYQILGTIPRYAIEGLAYTIVMAALLALLATGHDLQAVLPVASAFVLAGYRLLPALQNIYTGVTQWRFNQAVVDTLLEDLDANARLHPSSDVAPVGDTRLTFGQELVLRNLTYTYPNTDTPSIDNVSLSIRKNSFVAFTGTTGAGKTTLVDIILGLLKPDHGDIRIDGTLLTSQNRAQWQANIGYVPQEIYLTDSSIASNIAYGLPPEDIDMDEVRGAAKIANIDTFIATKLPSGYETVVGERGVRLSGGQRQRIGIARALYHDPAVIVLDEATSALDNETERRIVNELDAMRGGRTLIVIAHRLTTVQKCHEVFLLRDGGIAAHGSFDELVRYNNAFRYLANATDGESSDKSVDEEVRYGND